MKGNDNLIATLNSLLSDELTAVNQYMVHAEMNDNWGYKKLAEEIEKRAIQEMKHAEILIQRILFLEGIPVVSNLRKMTIGATVDKQFENDHSLEEGAVRSYNEGVKLAGEVKDFATREILVKILKDEDGHIDRIEEVQDQIGQMTLPIFLSTQN